MSITEIENDSELEGLNEFPKPKGKRLQLPCWFSLRRLIPIFSSRCTRSLRTFDLINPKFRCICKQEVNKVKLEPRMFWNDADSAETFSRIMLQNPRQREKSPFMLTRTLTRIREKIRHEEYVLTAHAEEEMDDDDFIEVDVETSILNGQIIRRQSDSLGRAKYIIEGTVTDGRKMQTVCRFSDSGNYVVIITVYEIME